MEIPEYKAMQDAKRVAAALQQMEHISDRDLSAESVRAMKEELSIARQTARRLEEEKHSPYRSFFYATDDKQVYVQQELERRGIPYREAENGFEAQVCYLKEIRAIERSYRTPAASYRDTLRDDIDRLLLRSSSFQELLQHLTARGYEVKSGKYVAVKPPHGERYIRLKSLGEFYSERALQNRIQSKLQFEKKISDDLADAMKAHAPNVMVLRTVCVYMEGFHRAAYLLRKRMPDKPFMWTNDPEIDKLLALNDAINHGKTLESMRSDFAKLTEQETEAVQVVEEADSDLQHNCDLKECCELLFDGKRSQKYSIEAAQKMLSYTALNQGNYKILYPAIESKTEKLQVAKEHYMHIHEQLQKASDQLELAERVFGGTYIQQLVRENNQRRQSEYIPSGYYPADGIRR